MAHLNELAALDTQRNEREPIAWKIVTSKECKQKHIDSNVDEPAVMLFI
jgi:hypothetical protein